MPEQPHKPALVVAEIGCNHRGDLDIAKDMVRMAATFCKVDAVKLQKRCARELLTRDQYAAPHPNPIHAYGSSYGAHREFLEFDVDQHVELKNLCDELGITYSTSVWDLTSAREIAAIEPTWLKIPSACNLNFEMLGWLCDEFRGGIHVSLGMTTRLEAQQIVEFFEHKRRSEDLVLYACTSGYPVPAEDICLMEISRLIETYGERVAHIGFSGHHLGIAPDIAAFTLGASWIERHYTLDRTWRGTDHAASLEPDGMRRLARDVRAVAAALCHKSQDILEIEDPQRRKLKWTGIQAA
ncbi:MAG: N-acetylneuraminate synthase family protein [Nannocystaceae bacterium]